MKADELLQSLVIRQLQIIGEASRHLTDDLRQGHPEVPWVRIIAMRNILVHDYFGLSFDEVWAVVERDLSDLKRKIEAIRREQPGEP